MILEEIEELSGLVKESYEALNTYYVLYLGTFPEYSAEIEELSRQRALNEVHKPKHRRDKNALIVAGELRTLTREDILHRVEEDKPTVVPISEDIKPNDADVPDRSAYTLRQLYRKICQLCHPDKCRRYSHIETKKLRDCFDEASDAYEHELLDKLEQVFIRVCLIRDEEHRLDEVTRKRLHLQLQNLQGELISIQQHPMYTVIVLHKMQRMRDARERFEEFLKEEIERLRNGTR